MSAMLLNDLVYNNTSRRHRRVSAMNGTVTISGGAVYDNSGTGIDGDSAVTIDDVQVHGNGRDGIDASVYTAGVPVIVSGNTVYANAGIGIDYQRRIGDRQHGLRSGQRQLSRLSTWPQGATRKSQHRLWQQHWAERGRGARSSTTSSTKAVATGLP